MERYFNAFESGTLTGRRLAGRVEELEARLAEVRKRREEIRDELERDTVSEPSQADLHGAIGAIAEAMESGNPSQRKALLQELVSEIRVESRNAIFTTYRLPNGPVRVISEVVGRGGLEPPTSALSARRSAS